MTQGLTATEHATAMTDYIRAGQRRAESLGNRGPLRMGTDGRPHQDILDAYWKYGFYVFEGAIGPEELTDLRSDMDRVFERAPVKKGTNVDAQGRPAVDLEHAGETFRWARPLSDPVGGTDAYGGRHPVKMSEPSAQGEAPDKVIYMVFGMLQLMDSALRLYGHPQLLAIAESLNGPDFTPFTEAIFVKQRGLGASVAWHQDGATHWDSPDWNEGIHGFNFQAQLYPSSPVSCLWVVPGSHKQGKLDIKAMVERNGGSDRLPDAVPLWCNAGDVTIVNRQELHCSFANTSPDRRVSLTFGFHRRASILGQCNPFAGHPSSPPGGTEIYDQDRISARSSLIQVAIDARQQRFPHETSYAYQPFVGREDEFRFNDSTREAVVKNYDLRDLLI